MKRIIVKTLLLAVLSFSFVACSKYEEGSKFTLLTKKSRLVNNWKVLKITADGTDITSWNSVTEVDIRDNGGITTSHQLLGIPTTSDGTWAFDDDKSHVVITDDGGDVDSYEIIKLKKDELKVQITTNSILYIHEYVTK